MDKVHQALTEDTNKVQALEVLVVIMADIETVEPMVEAVVELTHQALQATEHKVH